MKPTIKDYLKWIFRRMLDMNVKQLEELYDKAISL